MTDYTAARTAMVDCQIRPSDVTKYPIIEAMLRIKREAFVPLAKRPVAYVGEHIDLGNNRVVLDPRVLAKMLDALAIQPDELVLDIGCGLGYSSAVCAHLAEMVVAVEEDTSLAEDAARILSEQGVDNAVVHHGPLAQGAAEHGPYDVMVFEGGTEVIPAALLDQVKTGGRIGAIKMTGPLGKCQVGIKTAQGVNWKMAFDATAPILPGFQKEAAFAF
ncbi:MAG TPA: protein-L-isoaspartate O-methyltransferase [Paracoccaceae bacterium]|nr:protein-L-isoaspartate O-methyltransferase [Paracoccaceae bacterium]